MKAFNFAAVIVVVIFITLWVRDIADTYDCRKSGGIPVHGVGQIVCLEE